jgi:ABC-type amino acid transport substrate-binding protein
MRRFATVALLCAVALPLAMPAAASLGEVAADGKLTVIYADIDSPFLGRDAAGPRGFDYDVLQGFASRHGLSVEVVPVSDADELTASLRSGRGELIAGALPTTRRARARCCSPAR